MAEEMAAAVKRLILRRVSLGMSQQALADKIGVSKVSVGAWERRQWTPTLANYVNWCEALGLSPGKTLKSWAG